MRVIVETEVNAPVKTVWKIVSDIENAGDTITGIEKIEILEKAKKGLVGLKWRETRTMFGKTATEEMCITGSVAGTSYDTRAESHGAAYQSRIALEPRGKKTLLSMEFEATPVTFGAKLTWGLLGWMFRGATRKGFQADLDDIKRAAEARTTS